MIAADHFTGFYTPMRFAGTFGDERYRGLAGFVTHVGKSTGKNSSSNTGIRNTMYDRFSEGWWFVGGNGMHYVTSLRHGSLCGLQVTKQRVYSGHSTKKCKRCLKVMKKHGRLKE